MPAASSQQASQAIPQTGEAARRAIRRGKWSGPTSGLAPGYVQGNLAILPEKLAANRAQRSLRIWCAAVSSGQEAYSLAMILDEMAEELAGWRVEILGTDI